jgi:hypothetical protein
VITWPVPDDLSLSFWSLGVEIEIRRTFNEHLHIRILSCLFAKSYGVPIAPVIVGGVAVGNRLAEEVEGWSEAKRRITETQDMRLLAGAVAKGLDHSGTLEAEKRYAWWGGWHRSVSGVSFRREVLTRMSQDKPHVRATKKPSGTP